VEKEETKRDFGELRSTTVKDGEELEFLQEEAEKDPEVDYGLGSIFGAFIGDALGGPLEFMPVQGVQNCLEYALRFDYTRPGMNQMSLVPGQVTDDSEMAMCLI